MNKKASSILMIIFELVSVILIIVMVLTFSGEMGKSKTVLKVNLANDLKMMIDTLVSVPGDAIVEYPKNLSGLIVLLSQNKVQVLFEEDKSLSKNIVWEERSFYLPAGYQATGKLDAAEERACLEKSGRSILLRKCQTNEFSSGAKPQYIPSSITSSSFQTKLETGFLEKTNQIAQDLQINPTYLLAIMYFETGGTFSPSQRNSAGSGAVGLIQFLPSTAISLGTTADELSRMTQLQQLDYVKKYFEKKQGKNLQDLLDVYMVVLEPSAVGTPKDYVLFRAPSQKYNLNRNLDLNGDQVVTKEEAASKVLAAYQTLIKNVGTS